MSSELVTIATYPEPNEAQMAKAFLEMNGVAAFVSDRALELLVDVGEAGVDPE